MKTAPILAVGLCAVALCACNSRRDEETKAAADKLPPGCSLRFLGTVDRTDLYVTFCRDFQTTTHATTPHLAGKTTVYDTAAIHSISRGAP